MYDSYAGLQLRHVSQVPEPGQSFTTGHLVDLNLGSSPKNNISTWMGAGMKETQAKLPDEEIFEKEGELAPRPAACSVETMILDTDWPQAWEVDSSEDEYAKCAANR